MKIYFEDGPLLSAMYFPEVVMYIDARDGVSFCKDRLDKLKRDPSIQTVYTNSILAFSNRYTWDRHLKVPEIYIRSGNWGNFVRIDNLTNRELKEGHNLAKLYIAGEFSG